MRHETGIRLVIGIGIIAWLTFDRFPRRLSHLNHHQQSTLGKHGSELEGTTDPEASQECSSYY